ncbi:DUF429 domain-containing protein [Candidatus Bipolaricaulota bacterium]|nr:DUF429 domain-containing protein [Candidatus Bipolaricaulota bacterium]
MRFIGVDLAWSSANPTAAVALEWDGHTAKPVGWPSALGDDAEVVRFVAEAAGRGPALVAVDAPLVVPNELGARPCDRELSQTYRRAKAQAYPANRRRLHPVRGEALVATLEALGFVHDPNVVAREPVRQVVEVFPHPAAVELFGLTEILRYKARSDRPLPLRWGELRRYQNLLRSLREAEPRLEAEAILKEDPTGLRGKALKAREDLLDALFCAYIALHLWYWGEAGYRRFGDLATGYILVPMRPGLTDRGTPAGLG